MRVREASSRNGAVRLVDNSDAQRFEGFVGEELADIRSRDLEVLPICPFVRGYIARHPEYADLVLAR